MASEQRKMERRDFTYYMKVTDAATGNLIGYLVDISTGGFKLDSAKAIPTGKDFRLHLELSGDIANKSSLIFSARSIWCQPDPIDPTAYKVGFQIWEWVPAIRSSFNVCTTDMRHRNPIATKITAPYKDNLAASTMIRKRAANTPVFYFI